MLCGRQSGRWNEGMMYVNDERNPEMETGKALAPGTGTGSKLPVRYAARGAEPDGIFQREWTPAEAAPRSAVSLASVLRFKWWLLAVFVATAAPAVAAIWVLVTPLYEARAEIRVRPIIPRLVFKT
jgi:hypothetical protein